MLGFGRSLDGRRGSAHSPYGVKYGYAWLNLRPLRIGEESINLESLGLLGVFIAGATPWFEAIVVVPVAILFGLNPFLVVVWALAGNAITIFIFAYLGSQIREYLLRRRLKKGKSGESPRFVRAQAAFEKHGVYWLAIFGPLFIGTQFAAAIAVAGGVKPLKASLVITIGTAVFAIGIALGMVIPWRA